MSLVNGSWYKVPGKFGKRLHFVLTGENFSLCNIHESHFALGSVFPEESKKCRTCNHVLKTYADLKNRPTKKQSSADNYRSHMHENFEFKWDGSGRYY